MKVRILAAGVCFLLGACADSPLAPDPSFRNIGHTPFAPRTAEPMTIIRTSAAWDEFVRDTALRAPSGNSDDPIPNVGFPAEMAIALALGGRPSSAYRIRVDRVTREQSRLRVHAVEEIGCVGAAVITYPLAAIAVPSTASPVDVVWSKANLPCQ